MIGYKIVALIDGKPRLDIYKDQSFNLSKNEVVSFPGNGIYLSVCKDKVLDYYNNIAENQVLLTLMFDSNKIISGNIIDNENEISVPDATITSFEFLKKGELIIQKKSDSMNDLSM
jgi:hypothetical protein